MANSVNIKDFQNTQSMSESAQILMAAAVIVRIAFGQIASVNALLGKKVLSESDCKKAESAYKNYMGVLSKCHTAYADEAQRLAKQDSK